MKEKPLVSVIMAEYNTESNLLNESIVSILNQDYNNFELIIVDDCGFNNVEEFVKKYNDNRIKVIKNVHNCGLVYSLNIAIKNCRGKYIARMDTDDYSYKDRLTKQVEFMENNSQYDIIGGNCDYYDGKEIWGQTENYGEIKLNNILNGCPLIHPTVMYKKNVILKIGGYLNYNRCEDYATWIEAFYNGYRIYVMKDKFIRYHLSIEDYRKRSLKTRKGYFDFLKKQYTKLNPSKIQLLKMYIKNYVAGVFPHKIMYIYHKNKYGKRRKNAR